MVVNGGPASTSKHYSGYSLLLRCLPERSCHRLPADDLDAAASLCHAVSVLSLLTCSLPIKQCHNHGIQILFPSGLTVLITLAESYLFLLFPNNIKTWCAGFALTLEELQLWQRGPKV